MSILVQWYCDNKTVNYCKICKIEPDAVAQKAYWIY
jgi:hypothetical protein